MTVVHAGRRSFDVDLLVLDKDGTLIDFDRLWAGRAEAAVAAVLAALARNADAELRAELHHTLGHDPDSGRTLADSPLATAPLATLATAVAVTLYQRRVVGWHLAETLAREHFLAALQAPVDPAHIVPIGNLAPLLRKLAAGGLRLAIATSDSRAGTEAILEKLGVAELFPALVCGDDPLPAKPHPEVLRYLGRSLGVRVERMLVVGDSAHDLATGRSAGAAGCIGVLSGTADRAGLAPLADVVLESVHELRVEEA